MTPKEHIEDIRNEYENSGKKRALPSLLGSIEGIEMNFPRSYGSFLMEFIQNTDDAKSEKMRVEMAESEIRIFNTGEPFLERDVEGLCSIGCSKKKTTGDYIGYFGIGFKSIFLVSEHIEIYSGDYRFKFDKKEFSEENMPWQVIPLWLEQPATGRGDDYTTLFKVAVKDPKLISELREETEHSKPRTDRLLHNRLLLFLRKLRHMEISDTTKGMTRKVIKTPPPNASSHDIFSIEECINEKPSSKEKWLVFRSEFNVDDKNGVRQDEVTKMRKKDKIDKREAVVAFRLNDADSLMKEEKGTAYFGVHSYMPLKDVETGFNFLIQADFFTNTSRSALAADCLWNEWLAECIYQVIETHAIPAFKADEQWKFNFVDVLYTRWGGNTLFEKYVARPIRDYAQTKDCFVAEDGSFIVINDAVKVEPKIRALINDYDLKELYPDKKALHPKCVVPREVYVQEGPNYSLNRGINPDMERLLEIKAKQKDINFFRQFYKLISEYSEQELKNSGFVRQNIVLTDTWRLVVPDKAVKLNLAGIKISEYLKEDLKIVHSELMEPDLIKLFKALGVMELKESDIEEIKIVKGLVEGSGGDEPRKPWHEMTEHEKVYAIKLLKNEWAKKAGNITIPPLPLKTKSGKWISPAEIIFSKEYNSDHSLEELAEKGIYDLAIEFLSADFIESESDIWEWRRFFEAMGVDGKIRNKNSLRDIVQRIGIVMALSYEKDKGRQATELPRSIEKGGYDIISLIETEEDGIGIIESEKRLIEVKSSSSHRPNIPLSLNQSKTLKQETEFYVYVVTNALRQPQLYVTPGNKLKDLAGKITIEYNIWFNNAIEDKYSL